MLQRPNNLFLLLVTFFVFWSGWTLNGVVSDPETILLNSGCSPFYEYVLSNFSTFNENLNTTFREIRGQIVTQNEYFATAQQGGGNNPVSTLFQCRNYLSIPDCAACFDFASVQIRNCSGGAHAARVVYDGCFLRHETSAFFDQTTATFNAVSCGGNQTKGDLYIYFICATSGNESSNGSTNHHRLSCSYQNPNAE
ncbi:antifungal protein ginkbilobin-like protein 1 [Neltuma alba]|uniref:antifungal protein ginkbilobin-like protein 1 n=1 Tax=Neltuma alba TaxID=207710 RepID=UPI0010A43797|nr:antifungal protein ginkbilobin-like protein 1 [Prosopis alba]